MKRIAEDASRRVTFLLLLLLLAAFPLASAQEIAFRISGPIDAASLDRAIPDLANRLLVAHDKNATRVELGDLFWIQLAAGKYSLAHATMTKWRAKNGFRAGSSEGAAIVPLEL